MSKGFWKKLIEETIKRDKGESMSQMDDGTHRVTVGSNRQDILDLWYRVNKLEEILKPSAVEQPEPETNINEWLDLDIKDIPGDFFVNERYEYKLKARKDGVWESTIYTKLDVIENLFYGNFYFRYRLKPLESIRIPKKLNDYLYEYMEHNVLATYGISVESVKWNDSIMIEMDGHKVEII